MGVYGFCEVYWLAVHWSVDLCVCVHVLVCIQLHPVWLLYFYFIPSSLSLPLFLSPSLSLFLSPSLFLSHTHIYLINISFCLSCHVLVTLNTSNNMNIMIINTLSLSALSPHYIIIKEYTHTHTLVHLLSCSTTIVLTLCVSIDLPPSFTALPQLQLLLIFDQIAQLFLIGLPLYFLVKTNSIISKIKSLFMIFHFSH